MRVFVFYIIITNKYIKMNGIKHKLHYITPPQQPTLMENIHTEKEQIIHLFNQNVKGVPICVNNSNIKHCGKEGHWLETKMGIKHNSKNEPDIFGYEMKTSTKKTTLGDFSASEYAFSSKEKRETINTMNGWTENNDIKINRTEFIRYFGKPNPNKNNRYSWSGSCVPIYGSWNTNGQCLSILENNDIVIYYSYSLDNDEQNKKTTFPEYLKKENIVIAIWKADKMEKHINQKFNKKGFFMCKKKGTQMDIEQLPQPLQQTTLPLLETEHDTATIAPTTNSPPPHTELVCSSLIAPTTNSFQHIWFGKPFQFEYFIEGIKNKKIIFDSGMYEGNNRKYSQFRGGTSFWEELITEKY